MGLLGHRSLVERAGLHSDLDVCLAPVLLIDQHLIQTAMLLVLTGFRGQAGRRVPLSQGRRVAGISRERPVAIQANRVVSTARRAYQLAFVFYVAMRY